jgi:hypothetical protein
VKGFWARWWGLFLYLLLHLPWGDRTVIHWTINHFLRSDSSLTPTTPRILSWSKIFMGRALKCDHFYHIC